MNFYKKIGFLLMYILPFLLVLGFYGGGFWNFSAFVFAYGIVPLWDILVGRDSDNVSTQEDLESLVANPYFSYVLYSLVYTQLGLFVWASYVLANNTCTVLEYGAFTLSFMTITSGGINVAHELGHRSDAFSRFHAKLNLVGTYYLQFYIEHNRGHHVWVGTPLDPATARKGQNFYRFWWQTVAGSWHNAWQLERTRLQKAKLSLWSLQNNEALRAIVLPLVFAGLMFGIGTYTQGTWAWAVLGFFFLQSFLAFSSLEAVNYIEHYGILRREIAPNRYERINELHSWNSNYLISNFLLFQLQRHSDHHAHASRPYQVLRHFEKSPQLPYGYPVMIILALFPPLWFAVINKRLEEWEAQQKESTMS